MKTSNQTRYASVEFIPSSIYLDIKSKLSSLDNVESICKSDSVSNLTKQIVTTFSNTLSGIMAGSCIAEPVGNFNPQISISSDELAYVKTFIKDYLVHEDCNCSGVDLDSAPTLKYYDILAVRPQVDYNSYEQSVVIIVDENFLNLVTESKEELEKFYLSVLRVLYDNNLEDSNIVREYLGLKLNEKYFDLVLNRKETI